MDYNLSKQVQFSSLDESNVLPNPFDQFDLWLQNAIESKQFEPAAMVLSTVDQNLQPHARVVLLKESNPDGFVFYTNYKGNKGSQIDMNNRVSLLFYWPALVRQVRIGGTAEKISEVRSTSYFLSRPLESRIGAWASPQSQVIRSSEFLDDQFQYYLEKFGDAVPKPPFWGGYLVKPSTFEFWQGRLNRLHDRLLFSVEAGEWVITRLAP